MNVASRFVRSSSGKQLFGQLSSWQNTYGRRTFGNVATTITSSASATTTNTNSSVSFGVIAAASAAIVISLSASPETSYLSAAKLPSSGDIITSGTPVKEPATGILFPQLCNGFYYVGCGVRVKYGLVKVYAVGTYVDPLAMSAVSKSNNSNTIQEALLNPTYPRTIRIVINRNLSIDKYTAAIVDALKPRMMGQDLEKLEEFKALNPPVDLIAGKVPSLLFSLLHFFLNKHLCESS